MGNVLVVLQIASSVQLINVPNVGTNLFFMMSYVLMNVLQAASLIALVALTA